MIQMRPIASIFKKVTDVIKTEDAVNKVNERFKIQKYFKVLKRKQYCPGMYVRSYT